LFDEVQEICVESAAERVHQECCESLMCPPTHSAYQDAFGAGTYKFVGNTYTETTEFFYAPQYIGTSLEFEFKLDGDLWYTSGHLQHYEGGKKIDDVLLEQVFKRID
jgi:hypothetical protein